MGVVSSFLGPQHGIICSMHNLIYLFCFVRCILLDKCVGVDYEIFTHIAADDSKLGMAVLLEYIEYKCIFY